MFILSDLYRVAINMGERVLTPGMKKVRHIVFCFSHPICCLLCLGCQMVRIIDFDAMPFLLSVGIIQQE